LRCGAIASVVSVPAQPRRSFPRDPGVRSVAPNDIDGLLSAVIPAGKRKGLLGAARRVGSFGRVDRRRTSMRPIPGDIIGTGVADFARHRLPSTDHGFAIRPKRVVANARPEISESVPKIVSAVMMPEEMAKRGMRDGMPWSGLGKRFVWGKHKRHRAETPDQHSIHFICHDTH